MMPDVLFKGVPNQYVRGYIAEVVERTRPRTVVIPCAGAFAVAHAAVAGGARPEQLVCGDITLYSSAVGYACAGQPVPGLRGIGDWAFLNDEFLTDEPVQQCAVVTAVLRTLMYHRPKPTAHYAQRERELRDNFAFYVRKARETFEGSQAAIRGLRYTAQDLWVTIEPYVEDEDALLILDPPWYRQGYTKMFKGVEGALAWDAPAVAEFDPEDAPRLVAYLGAGRGRALVLMGTPVKAMRNPETEFGAPWVTRYVHRPSVSMNAVATWVLTNRPAGLREVVQRQDMKPAAAPKYKLFEGELTGRTRLWHRSEAQDVVGYYRDLLVHRLPLINTELYQVLLADGMLLGCLGFHVANLRTSGGGKEAVANLTFAFNPVVERYPKLNKLLLMCAVSSWWWAPYMQALESVPAKIQTTMLTPYPEAKIARGVMRLTHKERFKGQWKLTYYADVIERTAAETLELWRTKYGQPVAAATAAKEPQETSYVPDR